jgi:small-conductance mechanosensitive channel
MDSKETELARGARTEQRIAWLTLLVGCAAGMTAALLRAWNWAAGLVIGASLAWLNFRWLRQGLDALMSASTAQVGSERPRIPVGMYFRVLFRYCLIALAVYVIYSVLRISPLSMVVGFCSLGAATMAASVYEILRPLD